MWPFEKSVPEVDLAAIQGPTLVDVEVRVASPNALTSPVTGMRAAAFVIEVLSRGIDGSELRRAGALTIGDRLELEGRGDVPILALAQRVAFGFVTGTTGGHPITTAPPELVPLLAAIPLGGTACFREHAIVNGDRMRLRAVVERSEIVVTGADRSETRSLLVVRDDRHAPVLEELFAADL